MNMAGRKNTAEIGAGTDLRGAELINLSSLHPSGRVKPATCGYKLGLLGLFTLSYGWFYVYPNFNPWFQPRPLPLLAVDRAVPFLPWTFLIYFSEYFLIAIVIIRIKTAEDFNRFAGHAFTTLFFIGSIFFIFPTVYPRPDYPNDAKALVAFTLFLIDRADAPTNCFPSMHVAITSVSVYALRILRSRVLFSLCVLWGFAIFTSTLTTKQHYFLDILSGVLVAYSVIVVHRALSNRKRTKYQLGSATSEAC